jgi:urease accessory protein
MDWLPQATIFFDGARLARETHVELATDASLLAVECVIFGRTARGESVLTGALSDSWFLYRDRQLIHTECFAIADAIQNTLDRPMVLNGNRAMATLRYVAPDAEKRIEQMRSLLAAAPPENATISAASAWNGIMIVRFIARVLTEFRGKALPRVWLM